MTIKLAVTIATMALAPFSFAQTTIYWTGNGDRWGASPHTKWSLSPGGADYYQLQGGAEVRMNYDRNILEGANTSILINRQSVIMHEVTMTGNALGEGFALTLSDNAANNTGITLAGPLTVNSGQHSWVRPAVPNPDTAVLTLSADSTWTIADNAALLWAIPFASDSFGITKQGMGTLALVGDQFYTGDTVINAGTFGVFDGNASLAGNLSLASGAKLLFSDAYSLTLASGKQASFGGLGIADLVGLNPSVAAGTYTLINGDVDFTNIGNVGLANAVDIGGGKLAYFEQGPLNLVVVPEPTAFALTSLGIAGLLIFRRRVVL
jgi:autotransporter-associated beta strand protein